MIRDALAIFFSARTQAQDVIRPSFVTPSYFCPHLIISYYEMLFKHCIVGKILLDLYTGHRSLG